MTIEVQKLSPGSVVRYNREGEGEGGRKGGVYMCKASPKMSDFFFMSGYFVLSKFEEVGIWLWEKGEV